MIDKDDPEITLILFERKRAIKLLHGLIYQIQMGVPVMEISLGEAYRFLAVVDPYGMEAADVQS